MGARADSDPRAQTAGGRATPPCLQCCRPPSCALTSRVQLPPVAGGDARGRGAGQAATSRHRRRRVHTCTSRPDLALGPGLGRAVRSSGGGALLWGQGHTSFLPEHGAPRTPIDPSRGLSVLNAKAKSSGAVPVGSCSRRPPAPLPCTAAYAIDAFWRNPVVLGSSGTVIKCSLLCGSEREDRSQQAPTWGRLTRKWAE